MTPSGHGGAGVGEPGLHPDLAAVAPLLGTWVGEGAGSYPTIESFRYTETITVGHVGKPFLSYTQRTRAIDEHGVVGPPLHAEAGYLRFPAPGRAEWVLAQPSGIAEIQEGTVVHTDGVIVIELRSKQVALTSSAKSVTAVERTLRLEGDVLTYSLAMAAVGEQMTHHLQATLRRQP
jgi:hypothetical protein